MSPGESCISFILQEKKLNIWVDIGIESLELVHEKHKKNFKYFNRVFM
jgi:hypothetical protein